MWCRAFSAFQVCTAGVVLAAAADVAAAQAVHGTLGGRVMDPSRAPMTDVVVTLSTLLAEMRDAGIAVLLATHDLFRAKESGTRVGIMKCGKLVATLSRTEIAHSDFERVYLEHMHD
jgi:ABC-type cobalamin transport system ATPase subunit